MRARLVRTRRTTGGDPITTELLADIHDDLRAGGAGGAEHPCSAPAAGRREIGDVLPGPPGTALDPIDPFDHLELLQPAALPAAPQRRNPGGPVEARETRE